MTANTKKAPRSATLSASTIPANSELESNPNPLPSPTVREGVAESSLDRHTRKCSICRHPDREAIEKDFINWRSEDTIRYEFSLGSRSSIYRHAAATGLLKRRRLNLRGVCERIIERAEEAPPSAHAILRAVRIFAQITEDGEWHESPRRSIVTHIHITSQDAKNAEDIAAASGRPAIANVAEGSAGAPSSALSAEGGIATDVVPARAASPAAEENAENSDASSRDNSPDKITINTRWNKRLRGPFSHEILIGTQNHSPESVTNGEFST